jgi:C-terminal processing protease CtpA/Prc
MESKSTIRTFAWTIGLIALAGLAALALVQHGQLSRLRSEARALQGELQELDRLRAEVKAARDLKDQQAEIEKLREDNKDLLRLRNEVPKLRAQVAEVDSLRAANARFLQIVQGQAATLASNQVASVNAVRKQGSILGIAMNPTIGEPGGPAVTQRYKGVVVSGIMPDAPAAKADLKAGDIIVSLDGRPIESGAQLQVEMLTKRPGETVVLDLMRNDTPLRISVQTRAWPD